MFARYRITNRLALRVHSARPPIPFTVKAEETMREQEMPGLEVLDREEAAALLGGDDSWGSDVGYVLGAFLGGIVAFLKEPPQASYAYAKVGYPS